MAKIPCIICGDELGLLSRKIQFSDGAVCSDCLHSAGMSVIKNPQLHDRQSVMALLAAHRKISKTFCATNSVGNFIQVDENNKVFRIGVDIFAYENLQSFELLENEQTRITGGLGRAVVGNMLFGRVGAVVGGVTGARETTGVCHSMKLRVSLKNAHTDIMYIHFITSKTRTASLLYKMAQDCAQHCITVLEAIHAESQRSDIEQCNGNMQTYSAADEIMKFKALLDQGIITQAEFEAKKKQLLGL